MARNRTARMTARARPPESSGDFSVPVIVIIPLSLPGQLQLPAVVPVSDDSVVLQAAGGDV